MNPIFLKLTLAAQLVLGTNSVTLKFVTPGPGRYQVASSADCLHWRIDAASHVTSACHVSARVAGLDPVRIYAVSFQP